MVPQEFDEMGAVGQGIDAAAKIAGIWEVWNRVAEGAHIYDVCIGWGGGGGPKKADEPTEFA